MQKRAVFNIDCCKNQNQDNRPYVWLCQMFKINHQALFTLIFFLSFACAYCLHVGILYNNCAVLGFSSCKNLQVWNAKTRLGGKIGKFYLNTHKSYYSDQTQKMQTVPQANQSTSQFMLLLKSARKYACVSHDWFWLKGTQVWLAYHRLN